MKSFIPTLSAETATIKTCTLGQIDMANASVGSVVLKNLAFTIKPASLYAKNPSIVVRVNSWVEVGASFAGVSKSTTLPFDELVCAKADFGEFHLKDLSPTDAFTLNLSDITTTGATVTMDPIVNLVLRNLDAIGIALSNVQQNRDLPDPPSAAVMALQGLFMDVDIASIDIAALAAGKDGVATIPTVTLTDVQLPEQGSENLVMKNVKIGYDFPEITKEKSVSVFHGKLHATVKVEIGLGDLEFRGVKVSGAIGSVKLNRLSAKVGISNLHMDTVAMKNMQAPSAKIVLPMP
jgi:hypothetical protein